MAHLSRLAHLFGAALAVPLVMGAAPAPVSADELFEYGQYLSSQCSTCHRLDAYEGAIPPLGHLPRDYFIVAMREYKSGRRSNPAMVSVANALSDEEIEALAVYYTSIRE